MSQTKINTSVNKSSVAAKFHELRQSIEISNSVKEHRQSVIGLGLSQKNIPEHESYDEGDRKPHRNREISMNTQQAMLSEGPEATKQGGADAKGKGDKEAVANPLGKYDEHRVPLSELKERYQTDFEKGLTEHNAVEWNKKHGDNMLTPKKQTPAIIKLLMEMTHGFSLMLWAGTALCFIAYGIDPSDPSNYYLAAIIIFVILITGFITYFQNKNSEALMESFKNILPQKCTVIRDGEIKEIDAKKVVVGDIVKIKSGEKIPADVRILVSNEMKVDNSPLTGESEPQLRLVECTHPNNPLETANVAFFGTLCKEGSGKGVVIKIGDATTLGQIADLSSAEKKQKSPLRTELDRFVLMIACIAILLGVLFFLLGWLVTGYEIFFCVLLGIGILVANVPEGLLGCVTVSLAITAQALHKKNVLVKNLESVETLGSTSCICSDKTGTLTKNVMTVQNMWYNDKIIRAHNKKEIANVKNLEYDENDDGFKLLHHGSIVSSEARFDLSKVEDRSNVDYIKCPVLGDATETGIIRFYQYIEDLEVTRGRYKFAQNPEGVEAKMPFNSTVKFALTVLEEKTNDSDYCIYIKGAPEKIWKYCSKVFANSQEHNINEEWHQKFDKVNLQFGKGGERVLGFAKVHLPRKNYPLGTHFTVTSVQKYNFNMENFTFIGLISLIDPPKDTVPYAVLECRSAGIKVVMVTGDQPPTAAAIARQVNIIPKWVKTNDEIMDEEKISWHEAAEKCHAIVVHGDRIVESLDKELDENLPQFTYLRRWVKKPYCVFARTTPAQKLQIVQACQAEGFICAVTGDGVNDSPAIKQADIGISMNISGSDVTKDAADMILLNDDFSSIVNGVEEGRKIFDNIKKTTIYVLASNIPEMMPFLAFIVLKIPLGITNIFMICIDAGTDILPAISLGYEPAEIDVMTRRPRTKNEHLVSAKVIVHAYALMGIYACGGGFCAYYTAMNYFGFPVNSLYGMATMEGYKVDPTKQTNFQIHDTALSGPTIADKNSVFYNGLFMNNLQDCTQDLKTIPDEYFDVINWIEIDEGKYDLRKSIVYCDQTPDENGFRRWRPKIEWSVCDPTIDLNRSPLTNEVVCYSAEALHYAQTAYLFAIVIFQFSNIILLKARKSTFTTTPFNKVMFCGQLFEIGLCILIAECPGIQEVFGGRPVSFWIFFMPGVPWTITILVWEEVRKYLCRNVWWFEKYSFW